MPSVRISELPAIPAAQLTDLLAEVQPSTGGTTYKSTLAQILTLFKANSQLTTNHVTVTSGVGSYSPPFNLLFAEIELQGGGGGGGGTQGAAGQWSSGNAGGGGAYIKLSATKAQIGIGISYSIGVGGIGGAPGVNAGSNGGDTQIVINGSTWTAGGGGGGAGNTSTAVLSTSSGPGTSGVATPGVNASLIFAINGQTGGFACTNQTSSVLTSAMGGASYLGLPSANTGGNGLGYGVGAAGIANNSLAAATGQIGMPGVILITEYLN